MHQGIQLHNQTASRVNASGHPVVQPDSLTGLMHQDIQLHNQTASRVNASGHPVAHPDSLTG